MFLDLRLIVGQVPSLSGRGSPMFAVVGYGLIALAGFAMIMQSLHPARVHSDAAHSLTAGIGLLPCPLTISVLGFAWVQSNWFMVTVVLVSLALGIATTIGVVALFAILARQGMSAALGPFIPSVERWARLVQGVAGALIVVIGVHMAVFTKFWAPSEFEEGMNKLERLANLKCTVSVSPKPPPMVRSACNRKPTNSWNWYTYMERCR